MNRDLFTGLILSGALHFALVTWGEKAPPPFHHPRPVDTGIQFDPPPPDPEDQPVKVDDLPKETPQQQMAPPTQLDVPPIELVKDFIQPISPPPPPGLTPSNQVTIPVTPPGQPYGPKTPIFTMEQLSEKPTARVQPQPAYPYEMSRAGLSGEVVVEFVINERGDVIDARVIRSSNQAFETAATQAVMKWKFRAGRKDGKAVKVRASQLLEFNLEEANGK